MKIVKFPQANINFVAPPGEEGAIADLPCAVGTCDGHPSITSCWKPTEEEWKEMQRTGVIWLTVAGKKMPPVYLNGHNPFEQA